MNERKISNSEPVSSTLLLIRHGQAEPGSCHDPKRVLTSKGKAESKGVFKRLKEIGFYPESIFYSPFERTHQTAQIAHVHFPDASLTAENALLEPLDKEVLKAYRQDFTGKTLLFVGHGPSLSEWAYELTDGEYQNSLMPSECVAIDLERKSVLMRIKPTHLN